MAITSAADPVIKINAGGKSFTTKKETVSQAEDSELAAICSGSWQGDVEHDGTYFLDVDPACMELFLSYLRRCKASPDDDNMAFPRIKAEMLSAWEAFVKALNLQSFLASIKQHHLVLDTVSSGIIRTPSGLGAIRETTTIIDKDYHEFDDFALSSIPLTTTTVWQCRVFADFNYPGLDSSNRRDVPSYRLSFGLLDQIGLASARRTTCGWQFLVTRKSAIKSVESSSIYRLKTFESGQVCADAASPVGVKAGDLVLFRFDRTKAKFEMVVNNDRYYSVNVANPEQGKFFCVYLDRSTGIDMLPVAESEANRLTNNVASR